MKKDILFPVSDCSPDGKPAARWLLVAAVFFASVLFTGCATGVRVKNTTKTFTTVVIDAGHGGHDSGARSKWAGMEKTHALSVAHKVERKLESAGFHTVMTRRDDRFITLDQRVRISNRQKNAVFVSIHFNHATKRSAHGAEVFYNAPVARPMARQLLHELASVPDVTKRYAKAANFRVLRLNQYPAVLVECGFLSHPREGKRCASPAHQERLAQAITTGLIAARGGPPARPQPPPVPAPAAPPQTPEAPTPPAPVAPPASPIVKR